MKRIIFLSLFYSLLFFTDFIIAQSGWYWQNPLPQGNNLKSVSFANANTGFAVGTYGTVVKTTNKGETWNLFDLPSSFHYAQVKFTNSNTGYLLRSDNIILKTTNCGLNWLSVYYSVSNIESMAFSSPSTGIITSNGLAIKTTNGGINWFTFFTPPINESVHVVYCLNDFCIYFGGIKRVPISPSGYINKAIFYSSTNNGDNWNNVLVGTLQDIGYVYFFNLSTGYVTNNSGYMARTNNGGNSWQVFPQNFYTSLIKIRFLNLNTGFLTANGDSVFLSTNGGNNWTGKTSGAYDFDFPDSNTVVGVGSLGHLLKSTNSGVQFVDKRFSVVNTSLNSVHCVSDSVYYAGGGNSTGVIIKTTNGGKNWYNLQLSINDFITGIYFANELNGAAVTRKYIFHTTNGGINWIQQYYADSSYFENVCFINENTGYAGGRNNLLLKTTNGGNNWISAPLGIGLTYSGIQFLNQQTGFIFGGNFSGIPKQNIFKTTNQGLTWEGYIGQLVGTDIYFLNENTGITTGWDGKIFRTTNGGINWDSCSSVTSSPLNSITFINSQTGYIVGRNETILLKTTDSGVSWSIIPLNMSYDGHWLYRISSCNGTATFVGGNGIIKNTRFGGSVNIKKVNTKIIPSSSSLSQNYPNPFNPSTIIRFQIKDLKMTTLKVYDILGKEVATLVNEKLKPGEYEVIFDGSNLPSGVYYYKLTAGDFTETKKMLMIK